MQFSQFYNQALLSTDKKPHFILNFSELMKQAHKNSKVLHKQTTFKYNVIFRLEYKKLYSAVVSEIETLRSQPKAQTIAPTKTQNQKQTFNLSSLGLYDVVVILSYAFLCVVFLIAASAQVVEFFLGNTGGFGVIFSSAFLVCFVNFSVNSFKTMLNKKEYFNSLEYTQLSWDDFSDKKKAKFSSKIESFMYELNKVKG
ncbi:hypothetical protein [Pseudoalteromonas phage J2-1_QLiu-2017]|nr:hypothetical protein [Pseudoalteromonas phage J2-1_QLiu-2017]